MAYFSQDLNETNAYMKYGWLHHTLDRKWWEIM